VPETLPPASPRSRRRLVAAALTVLLTGLGVAAVNAGGPGAAAATTATTAWRNGTFDLNPDGLVSRDDIVLGQPNISPTASIPLGNGALGVAAWAANGFTAQLNRSDTMPDRKSPGQVTIPGLSVISHAADFRGRLDLTDGVPEESGGGMSMKAWVSTAKNELITDVTGANPNLTQTASIYLWSGRNPTATDTASVTATRLIGNDANLPEQALLGSQERWWGSYWAHSGLVEMNSADGSAAYIENLRTLYLYDAAASSKAGTYFGSQAGEADMFGWSEDQQTWAPNDYWIWNLRGEISANMSSGNYQLNTPIFDMYINDLPAIEAWTKAQMGGLPGACVPETMSFNGNGYYSDGPVQSDASCALAASPQWNAEDISSGPEMSLSMWEQYEGTGDLAFLKKAFGFMEATAQFLLAYQQAGSDGLLHAVANAHETQWAVQDPTTDIAADQAIFPIIADAAKLAGDTPAKDPLLAQFAAAIKEIPDGTQACTATASDGGTWSCTPSAALSPGAHTLTATAADLTSSPVTSSPVQITVQS
jgi:hypothetical protein